MRKHSFLMMLCCIAPMVLLMIFGKSLGLSSWLILLLCPLMHMVMMLFMRHDHGEDGTDCHSKTADANEK